MKIGIISDLHLEFAAYDLKREEGVFYINAGDIHPYTDVRNKWITDNHIDFHVLGNHDFYKSESFKKSENDLRTKTVNGLTLAGATLWTDLSNHTDWIYYINGLVDKRYIRDLEHEVYVKTHKRHKEFLMDSNADIWVTHHCVSYKSVHPKYMTSPYNSSFTTELSNDILSLSKPPKLIIHGHTHEEFDYMIGDTRVVCHPRGYPNENSWFKTYQAKIINIE